MESEAYNVLNSPLVELIFKFSFYIFIAVVLYICKRYFDKKLSILEKQEVINTNLTDTLNEHSKILSSLVKTNEIIQSLADKVVSLEHSFEKITNALNSVLESLKRDYISKEICELHRKYLKSEQKTTDDSKK